MMVHSVLRGSRTGRQFSLLDAVHRHRLLLALIAGSSLLASLAASSQRIIKVVVNRPPETVLSAGPPDSSATNYRVWLFWSGTDLDGAIDHFDFIMVDHPASKDSIGPGGTNPVIVTVPAPDDPRWTFTSATDSLFVTLADSLRRDPRPGPGETPGHVLRHPFERWHSFFIRAVDDSGVVDPTPAYRSFNSQNLAPTVRLLPPVLAGAELIAPPTVVFNWDGEDPVDEVTSIDPVASRWVLIPSRISFTHPGSIYTSYPDSLYELPSRFAWSDWMAWDLPDGAGRRAVVSNLLRVGEAPGSGYYIFAVQAMDEAGAITPVFDFASPGKNNVALIRVSGTAGPVLTVRDAFWSIYTFAGDSNPLVLDIPAGQPVDFRWSADASHYAGSITGYRYGWDIQDPANDQEWSDWSPSISSVPPQTFTTGTHRFSLQARDNAETITQAVFELKLYEVTRSRDLLWVDDTDHLADTVAESREDSRWIAALERVAENNGLLFDPNVDVYDIVANNPPNVTKLFDYKAIVWSVRSGFSGSSGLRRMAQFFDPIPDRNKNTGRNNALKVYIRTGGRLWVNGFRPASQLWPAERSFGSEGQAVNVTSWDDPLQPHPTVDSIGTTSLLYRMGIEMFDVGSALESPRKRPEFYCHGLRPAAPGIPDLPVGANWGQAGTGGRVNIEIFNMPIALATQMPPLVPPSDGTVRVLYTYVSQLPEDPLQGYVYPVTADNQPIVLVSKPSLQDLNYTTAFCGFEPYLLDEYAHDELTRHLLIDQMGLGPTPVYLQHLAAIHHDGVVSIRWEVEGSSDPAEFQLRATMGDTEWEVEFTAIDAHAFAAIDDSPHLASGGTVTYSLYAREPGQPWTLLGQETITLAATPPRLQLLAPQPNPFNPRVAIPFVLPARQHVRLEIYSVDGQHITTLVDAVRPAGAGTATWDGTGPAGKPMSSGLYLALLESGGTRLSRKLVLMK